MPSDEGSPSTYPYDKTVTYSELILAWVVARLYRSLGGGEEYCSSSLRSCCKTCTLPEPCFKCCLILLGCFLRRVVIGEVVFLFSLLTLEAMSGSSVPLELE